MSHKASHWLADISPALLKDSDFRVLFHLCDAHNSTRPPETACFPGQELLRAVTGLSNGGLNNSLNRLEDAGLLRRRRTRAPDGTKGPTYYILGCDFDPSQGGAPPPPKNGVGGSGAQRDDAPVEKSVEKPVDEGSSISTLEAQPSPHWGSSQLHERGDKPVIDPLKETRGRASARDRLEFRAETIKAGHHFLCNSISAEAARECIHAGLVSLDDCRRAGIAI